MPPEVVALFKDWPAGLLLLFLASPFLVLIGVALTALVAHLRDRGQQKVAEKNSDVSETEAETHRFQAIFDGFSQSLAAVSQRAEAAEKKAGAAELVAVEAKAETELLKERVKILESERHDAIDHVILLETLIPFPPGPPPRPIWMQRTRP